MSDDEELGGPGSQAGSYASGGPGADPGPPRGPSGLPKRTAGGPGPARKSRPSRGASGDTPREHSALDPTAPFGRRFQSLGRRIDDANQSGTPGTRPSDDEEQDAPGADGGAVTGDGAETDPTPDVSLFDEPPRTPRQRPKESAVTVRVKPAAESPRRTTRRRVAMTVAGAVGGVLVIGGVLFAVLPKGEPGDRSGSPFGLSTAPGAGPTSEESESVAGGKPAGPAAGTGGKDEKSADPGKSAAKTSGAPDGKAPANSPGNVPSDATTVSGGEQAAPAVHKPPAAPPENVSMGVSLFNHGSGRCVSIVNGGAAVSGERLEIRDCADVPWQRWQAMPDGTLRAEGKCMDLNGNVTDNGVTVGWVDCNGTSAQLWTLNSSHDLVNAHADRCLDVTDSGTANGTRLQIWDCSGKDNQKWSIR